MAMMKSWKAPTQGLADRKTYPFVALFGMEMRAYRSLKLGEGLQGRIASKGGKLWGTVSPR
jgi:hypothetical protein